MLMSSKQLGPSALGHLMLEQYDLKSQGVMYRVWTGLGMESTTH